MNLRALALFLGISLGTVTGIGGYTFVYAKGYSYLSNDPAACANCHVMNEQFDGWNHGSHRAVATCNDCHTPSSLIPKYATKAKNGFWHSFYFTTGHFPEPIRITEGNRRVTEGACRACHADIVHAIDPAHARQEDATECIRCHRDVGHRH
jgi:cytochrome c nitrite reductase small subunit